MSRFDHLMQMGMLPDISYRTDPPEEVVHPRVMSSDTGYTVYLNKEHQPLEVCFRRLATGEAGLRVAAYRNNGRQTTISFNKHERVTLSPRLLQILAELRR